MTSTPVKDVGLGLGGTLSVGESAKTSKDGGFQAVWNSQAERQADSKPQPEENQTVKKTPGDSLKARDEHRARTEKREPSRDVEERTDIPEEKLEEAAEVLEAAAVQLIQEIADTLGVEPEEVQAVMADLGLEPMEVLEPQALSSLILAVSGEESPSALLTNEELYGSYQELMGQLETVLQECGESLEVSPEQLKEMLEPVQQLPTDGKVPEDAQVIVSEDAPEEVAAPQIVVEQEEKEPTDRERPVKLPEEPKPVEQENAVTGQVNGRETDGNQSREDRKDTHHEGGREQSQNLNLFAESQKTGQYEPQVQQTYSTESVWDTDTQNIMRQIMDYMKVNLKAEMSTMEMQLHPASLGTLQVQVASKGGVLTANFITQNEAVKAALESQMVQLQEQFEEQGVKVAAIEVTVQTHQFEQNLEQGRRGGGQEQEPARKGRTRRIDLNDSISMEEMEEEDALAKDIMIANGNTVDYTA